ncbi:hypothetical protein JL720_16257 [Aureococcus anophagefferens]|nr:hypothetical protein JL720_16257 [Aureococcus anophagefferens]
MIARQKSAETSGNRPKEAFEIELHPFLPRSRGGGDTARDREARQRCWAEVKHLPLIPLEDGSVAACRPRRRVFDGPATTAGAALLRPAIGARASRAASCASDLRATAALGEVRRSRAADAARREAAADEAAADAAEDELERRRCAEMGETACRLLNKRRPAAPAEAPTPAGDRDRTRRLFGALRALGAPILEARYWPPDRRGAVVAAASGGSVKAKALRCLGAAPALKWDRLDGAATTALLEELHPCATSPSLVATLRALPLFKALGGDFAPLGEGDLEALSPRALDAVRPYAAPADLAGFLERPATAALRDLYGPAASQSASPRRVASARRA